MSMYIGVNENTGLATPNGIFEHIVEETRDFFSENEKPCLKEIYASFDDEGQTFISLDGVDICCFNLFYKHCKQAMDNFINSKRGKVPPKEYIPVILNDWSELLRIMKEDQRYQD